jgi:apolipoprotein N-acyltransferase
VTRPAERGVRALTYALAILATPVLHGLSFPPWSLWYLAWIAFVPWFAALRLASTTPRALLVTCVTTLAGSYAVAGWLPRALAGYWSQPPHIGAALFVGVWLVTVAPAVVVFTLCYRAAARRHGASMAVVAGAAWAGTELLRVGLGIGDPFGLLGYTQAPFSSLVQIADATGVYGVSFAVAAVNAALAESWLAAGGHARYRAAGGAVATAFAVVLLCLAYPHLRGKPETDRPPQRIAVAQANLDLDSQWSEDLYEKNLTEHLQLTHEALAPRRPALVVWPEGAMTFFFADEPLYRQSIAQVLAPADVELLAGGVRAEDHAGTRDYFNAAFLLAPTGEVVAHYDEQRALPFAEYLPFDAIGAPKRELGLLREFTPGPPTPPLPTRVGAAGVVIGNEAMFPRIVARRVLDGAELLVSLSDGSRFGDRQLSLQALDMARLRAIEQRRDLIRASTAGPSAIIDARGEVRAITEPFTRATLAGIVHGRAQKSFYAQVGDAFAIGCVIVVVVELGTALLRLRRPRVPAAPIASPTRKKIGG